MASSSHLSSKSIFKALAVLPFLFSHLASAQNGDGGAADGNLPGTAANGDTLGAQGPSQSSANISTGATIAIAVVVAIVVIMGVLTAVLFWQAKKRQWTIRETLRRSTKRVATGLKGLASPLTPNKMTFSPLGKTRFDDEDMHKLRGGGAAAPPSFSRRNREGDNPFQTDLEKGTSYTAIKAAASAAGGKIDSNNGHTRGQSGPRPKAPMIRIPSSSKKVEVSPQTPMWTKFLGRT